MNGILEPVLSSLLIFHPGWITRSVTSHDPAGGNGDGSGRGLGMEGEHHVLFHAKGEGRILRLWMTADLTQDVPRDYRELWIEVDGRTVFRGPPLDYFTGRGPAKSPLVLGYEEGSGAFVSYVPFAYSRGAKIRFKGDPHYYQVTYRAGAGASAGPSSEELTGFLSEPWEAGVPAPSETPVLTPATPRVVATGPATVASFALLLSDPADLKRLRVRVGAQEGVPAAFFFGMGTMGGLGGPSRVRASDTSSGDPGGTPPSVGDTGWASFRNALQAVNEERRTLVTRLPIPLRAGETLTLEAVGGAIRVGSAIALAAPVPGVRLLAQFRDQAGPGTETTMPFFEHDGPAQFVSLVEEITGGKPGDRAYLEGDEMIRTDAMTHPVQLGTGTEDYFNGGWYFRGAHANPLSGQPRFVVNDPEDGWKHARYEHSLYRHHVVDPIVSRSGLRFGFEAGATGAYTPVRYRTLGLAYAFDAPVRLARTRTTVKGGTEIVSAVDAERSQPARTFRARATREVSRASFACPAKADAVFVVRTYDAGVSGSGALVRVNGRDVGELFEAYANPVRRFAQDAIWIDLLPAERAKGRVTIEFEPAGGTPWTEGGYEATFYASKASNPRVTTGPRVHLFDSVAVPQGRCYVNDHTLARGPDGRWHLYGIFHSRTV